MKEIDSRTMYINFGNFVRENREKIYKEIEQILKESKLNEKIVDDVLDKMLKLIYLSWFEGRLISEFEQKFE